MATLVAKLLGYTDVENSTLSDVYSSLPAPEHSGWMRKRDGTYDIEWEAAETQAQIQTKIDFFIKRVQL